MDDLISRQAAIEVIDAVFPVNPTKSEYAQGLACGVALAKTYVEQLPSAQSEIIRCVDCKWWERESICEGHCLEIDLHHVDEDHYCSRAERRTDEPDR